MPLADIVGPSTQKSRTHLAWLPRRLRLSRIEYLDQGQAWVDLDEFRDCCSNLVDRVVRRLVSLGIEGTLLQEEWASAQAVDQDQAMFCETAARLGWDPYSIVLDER